MLLSSTLPFYGQKRQDIVNRILENQYSFRGNRSWRTVSRQAKEFIKELLVSDPEQRPDAQAALASAWLSNCGRKNATKVDVEEEERMKASMAAYARYPKLKKMVSEGRDFPFVSPLEFPLILLCTHCIKYGVGSYGCCAQIE